jgi:MFS superfamily sulfate permease-like transporter
MTTATPNLTSSRRSIGRELTAGLVVFLVALPLCLGIALASGAPKLAPMMSGLIAGVVGGLVVGALSGSQVSVSGPAAGLAAVVMAQIQGLGSFQAFLVAVVYAGLIQIGVGLLRGGGVANFVPNNVIKGLLAAIGLLLILKQLPHLLGDDTDPEGDESFVQIDGDNTFTEIVKAVTDPLPGAALVGFAALATLIVWERTKLKKTPVPGPLAAVLAGVAISELLAAMGSSWAIAPSHMVQIPAMGEGGVLSLLTWPDFGRAFDPAVLLAAVTLAAVASLETLLNLEATMKLDPLHRPADPNRELVAQGVGNAISGAIGGLPITSVIVRSSVNINAGGRTRVSIVFHALLLAVAVLLLAEWMNRIPLAALAAVLITTGLKLASPQLFVAKWRAGRAQFLPFVTTVLAILFTDLLVGVLVGLAVSLSFVFVRNMRGGFEVVREDHIAGPVQRFVLGNQVSFLARARLATLLAQCRPGEHVAIDARTTDYVDPDILSVIRDFASEEGPARGVKISLMGFQDRYRLRDVVQYVDYSSREVQASLTPQRVLDLLQEGNARFLEGRRLHRDLARQIDGTAEGQHPMAVVLGCIDSRAPAELLFDLGIGDVFVARLAGNVCDAKALGSMEFACKAAGAKLIVVLGHTRCGAVKATCDFVHQGVDAVTATGMTNLGSITSAISAAVRMETATQGDRTGRNAAFVDGVAAINVHNTMLQIERDSPTLMAMLQEGKVGIVGAMYDVATGRVRFLESLARNVALPLSSESDFGRPLPRA